MKFTFVILHYHIGSIIDTIECINSIINFIVDKDYNILVVDNGSPDNSFKHLSQIYSESKIVKIISSKVNLGFSKGNNFGIDYALEHYSPTFYIVINNDTLITQSNFLKLIEEEHNHSNFDILGPDIINLNGKHQNLDFKVLESKKDVLKEIRKNEKELLKIKKNRTFYSIYFNICILIKAPIKILFRLFKPISSNKTQNIRRENVPLHGSAIIFHKNYILNYPNDSFFKHTFMFAEEDILFQRVKRDNLISIYQPRIVIIHKEDSSTNQLNPNRLNSYIFKLNHKISSLKTFYQLL